MTVDYHAWTHRAPWNGGTDPVEPQLPYITAVLGSPAAITTSQELELFPVTNDPGLFAWDSTDKPGMLLTRGGMFLAMADTVVASLDQNDKREMMIGIGRLSDGPAPGGEYGDVGWSFGAGQGDHSTSAVTTTSGGKTRLHLMAMQTLSVVDPQDPGDIYRLALYVFHQGTNYTVTQASLTIVRIGTDNVVQPNAPVIGT